MFNFFVCHNGCFRQRHFTVLTGNPARRCRNKEIRESPLTALKIGASPCKCFRKMINKILEPSSLSKLLLELQPQRCHKTAESALSKNFCKVLRTSGHFSWLSINVHTYFCRIREEGGSRRPPPFI